MSAATVTEPGAPHRQAAGRGTAHRFERRVLRVLRPLVIALLLLVSLFPFYYMVLLSFRPLEEVLQNPGSLWVSPGDMDLSHLRATC